MNKNGPERGISTETDGEDISPETVMQNADRQYSGVQELLLQVGEKLKLIDRWRERPPKARFYARQAYDTLRRGRLMTEFSSTRPLNPEQAADLEEKKLREGLSAEEGAVLENFYTAKRYTARKEHIEKEGLDPKVLYVAAGRDGLPGEIFGRENVTMLSDNTRYCAPYEAWKHQFEASPKIKADMYRMPVADHSFDTVLIHRMGNFSPASLRRIEAVNDDTARKEYARLFTELRRVVSERGAVLIAAYTQPTDPGLARPSEAAVALMKECGFDFKQDTRPYGTTYAELIPIREKQE